MIVRVAAQNEFFTHDLAPIFVSNSAISISGSFFLGIGGPNTPDFAAFVSKTQAQVETRIQAFLNGHSVDPQTAGFVIIDIEDPDLEDMHLRPQSEQDQMIAAFVIRIAATRVKFPNAKIALYGTLNPDSQGRADNATYLARLAALVRAGQMGMYDGLDFVMPVLYPRFGPRDSFFDTIGDYTRLGITGARDLRYSGGQSIPILPITGLWIANGNSQDHNAILFDLPMLNPLPFTLGLQLDIFQRQGITDVVVWVGQNEAVIGHQPNPNKWTVKEHLCLA